MGKRAPALAAALLLAWSGAAGARAKTDGAAENQATRAAMARIFDQIRFLLPLSADLTRWSDPERREAILASLWVLTAEVETLSAHASGEDFLQRSLAAETGEIAQRYASGSYESSSFLLHQVTEYCVACHARLPDAVDSPLAADFARADEIAGLPSSERARILIATRQWNAALDTLEEMFLRESALPAAVLGFLTDYLTICVRVKNDFERPISALRRFSQRRDLWSFLRDDVERWIVALEELRERARAPASLPAARLLLQEAKLLIRFPADRGALIHYIVASTVLHRYVESNPTRGTQLAEAYYLLGVTESRIGRTYWVSQARHYLETAIRMAPHSEAARSAYALLEEETVLEYTGSAGTHVPRDVAAHLAELRLLMDEPQEGRIQ